MFVSSKNRFVNVPFYILKRLVLALVRSPSLQLKLTIFIGAVKMLDNLLIACEIFHPSSRASRNTRISNSGFFCASSVYDGKDVNRIMTESVSP